MINVYPKKILHILCSVVAIGLIWACDTKTEKQKKPQLVRKKIVAKDKKTDVAKKTTAPDKSATKTPTPVKSDKPVEVTPSKTAKVKVSKKATDKSGKKQKSVLTPKYDISKTESKPAKTAKKVAVAKKDVTPTKTLAPKKVGTQKDPSSKEVPVGKKAPVGKKDIKRPDTKPGPQKTDSSEVWQIGESKSYNPRGKIDPFAPLVEEKPIVVAAKRKKRVPRTPLEKISLSQLKLVAIIRAPSGNKACVEESSGKGYIIKKGDYIGLNSGKVVKISSDNIVIEEEVENSIGDLTKRKKQIKLPKTAGE